MINKKISIVGAGPSGILLAIYLLHRQDYQVSIYERRGDPRNSPTTSRNYPLVLCQRGLEAFKGINNLEEAIKLAGIEIEGAICFDNNTKQYKSERKKLVSIHRQTLVTTLLNYVESKYSQEQIKVRFNCKYVQADILQKKATFQLLNQKQTTPAQPTFFTDDYDILVGADGVHSAVRNNCLNADSFELEKKCTHLTYKNLFISSLTDETLNGLNLGRIYGWRSPNGITLLASRRKDETASCTLFIPNQNKVVDQLNSVEEVFNFFQTNFPVISSSISNADAQDFLQRKVAKIWTIRCNRYHYSDSVMIMGDAAHAISPSIGQGCNSALEDVVVLNSLLDKYSDDWAQALPEYSRCRVADAHAVKELADNALPLTKVMFVLFIMRLTVTRTLHKLFPKLFSLPFFDLIADTTIAYSEIYDSAKHWIGMVKRSNERFLKSVETSKIN